MVQRKDNPLYLTGTTIRVSKEVKHELEKNRIHPDETLDTILKRMLGMII